MKRRNKVNKNLFFSRFCFLMLSIASAGAVNAAPARLSCDASPNYPKWQFGQGLGGELLPGSITTPISGGFVGTDLILHRGSIATGGSRNALLERLARKCLFNTTNVTIAPSAGTEAYISTTTFDGGDERSSAPWAILVNLHSTDGREITGPVFENTSVTKAKFILSVPLVHFSDHLRVGSITFEFQPAALSTQWKQILAGLEVASEISISGLKSWRQVDFQSLQKDLDLRKRSVDLAVKDCSDLPNSQRRCLTQAAPIAELHQLVETQQLATLRLLVGLQTSVPASSCLVSNLSEVCADPVLSKAVTFYQIDEYGFPIDSKCGQPVAACSAQ
jgi:hypothetical protein